MLNIEQIETCKINSSQTQDFSPKKKKSQEFSSVSELGAELFGVTLEKFNDWRWQLKNQVRTRAEAVRVMQLTADEQKAFAEVDKVFNIGISPYSMSLMAYLQRQGKCTSSLRRQLIPQMAELYDPRGEKDPLEESNHSPVREVVHAYPDRVAFCVAQLCPVYCRYCFRKRRDDEVGLHYNRRIVDEGVAYIASQKSIRDVLVTGGDSFITSDASIENLLQKLSAIPHVDVIRFGTRTPVSMPQRITDSLMTILKKYHPVWLNTHFNSVDELTPEACEALRKIADAGIPIGNQTVLLRGVNDSTEQILELCRKLVKNRVRPYYLFYPHMIEGTEHLRVNYRKGIEIIKGLRGNLSGFAIPTYVMDTPSGKIPLSYNHILREEENDLILEDLRGEIWREADACKISLL